MSQTANNKMYLPSNYQITSYTSKLLMKLGNILRVEMLNLNFSIKDGLKIVSKTKTKNCWSVIDYRKFM